MAHPSPEEDHPWGEAPTDRVNAPPAEPIEGRLAVWTPRAATIGCMGLTYWLASRNKGPRGVMAVLFPLLGSDVASRSQASYLVTNLISPVLIWMVEANRRGTSVAKLALQSLAGAAVQIRGIETIAPIYYLFSMASWDSAPYAEGETMAPDMAKSFLTTTLMDYALLAALVSSIPLTATGVSRSILNFEKAVVVTFALTPAFLPWFAVFRPRLKRYVDRKFGRSARADKSAPNTTDSYQSRDSFIVFGSLKLSYAVIFAVQASQHLYTIACNFIRMPRGQRSLITAAGSLLANPIVPRNKYSSIALFAGATLGFELYTVWELRRRGMVSNTEATIPAAGVLAGQVLFGPGATYAGLWWWREGVLARNSGLGMRTF